MACDQRLKVVDPHFEPVGSTASFTSGGCTPGFIGSCKVERSHRERDDSEPPGNFKLTKHDAGIILIGGFLHIA